MTENLSGRVIKGYELLDRVGAGGFGAVYRTFQSTVGREIALKVILPGHANKPEFIRRFEFEAHMIARLEHLHVVPLYDFWRDASGAYLAMRWLRGGSFQAALREEPIPPARMGIILKQIGSALTAAHQRGVIHRDIKPSNILLDEEGNAYLADFGIAVELDGRTGIGGEDEAPVGSVAYLSPEQARRELATERSDIYSLGVTVFEGLQGRHPFSGSNAVELLYKHLNEPLPLLEGLPQGLDEPLNEFIQKATAKDPSERYLDVPGMIAAFQQAIRTDEAPGPRELTESLTPREQQILGLIADGQANKEIADGLFIELSTVKWYITQIYRKLGIRSRTEAILRARDLKPFLLEADSAAESLEKTQAGVVSERLRNPYKGLRAFETADAQDFFGRHALIARLLERMMEPGRMSRFLAIVGPSGSGKSSLIKAGLIPALRAGEIASSERWFMVDFVPGSRPLEELEIALTRIAADQSENLMGHLQRDGNGLLRAARLILPKDGSELLLVIDQFEEVFQLVELEQDRSHFLSLICAAATDPTSRIRIVIALRADAYHLPLQYPDFGELIRRRLETVLPLSAEQLEQAIYEPAQQVGASFEPGLIRQIIDDIRYQPGALPSLQFALAELFEKRTGNVLTHAAYEDIGGAVGALATRAESLYREQPPDGKAAMRKLFLSLLTIVDETDGSTSHRAARVRVHRASVLEMTGDPDRVEELVETLTQNRLLSADHDARTRQPTIELAHEAIIPGWERLRAWLEEEQEDLLFRRRLQALASEWEQGGKTPDYLLRGGRLDQLADWAESTDFPLPQRERTFLQASLRAKEVRLETVLRQQRRELETAQQLAEAERRRAHEQEAAARKLRRRALVLAGLAVLALLFGASALLLAREAESQRRLSFTRELAASSANVLNSDPELSLLLALEASHAIPPSDLPGAVEAVLHQALQRSRVVLTLSHGSAAAYSQDGSVLGTGDGDGTITLWDADTGQELRTLNGHSGPVTSLAFSPDGENLASVGLDGVLRIWDVEASILRWELRPALGDLVDVDISDRGQYVAVAGAGGAQIRSLQDGRPLTRYGEHESLVSGIAFSASSRLIATYGQSAETRLWDPQTGKTRLVLAGSHPGFISGIDMSPDGSLLAASSENGLGVWRIPDGELVTSIRVTSPIADAAFGPDGSTVALVSEAGAVSVWDSHTGEEVLRLGDTYGSPRSLAYRPDGKHLAVSTMSGQTRVFDLDAELAGESLSFSAGSFVYDVTYSPDGSLIAVTTQDSGVMLVDPTSAETVIALESQPEIISQSAFSPDGRFLATPDQELVAVYDLQLRSRVLQLTGPSQPVTAVEFSPQGDVLASGYTGGGIILWEVRTGEKLASLSGHRGPIGDLDFSPDAATLASSGWDSLVLLWEVPSGRRSRALTGHRFEIFALEFSPDGSLLGTAAWDLTGKIWDPANGTEIATMVGHTGNLNDISLSVDGSTAATVSFDGTVRLWDARSGVETLVLAQDHAPLTGVDFHPDGTRLIVGGSDGLVAEYVLDISDLLQVARSRVTRPLTDDECRNFLHLDACPDRD